MASLRLYRAYSIAVGFLVVTFQNLHDGDYGVPIPCRRPDTEQFVDLPKMADRFHVATVHSEDESLFRRDNSHEPLPAWRKCAPPRRFYSPVQVRQLLAELGEPCRTVVLLAVLTGMRIGEILALRWKRVDLLRGTIEIAESFSNGQFGSPKTRSSNRVIPMSSILQDVLETYRAGAFRNTPDDLVFCTPKGTPLNSKNLYNRALAPACDRIKQPRISWHSFRHTHATQLAESGESLKTAQALLGHSDLETTLNTYTHVIPESQRRAVDRVAGVLFSNVLKLPPVSKEPGRFNQSTCCQLRRISGEPRRTRTSNPLIKSENFAVHVVHNVQ